MPCRVDVCSHCGDYDCPGPGVNKCIYPNGKPKKIKLDTSGALCDVLTLLEDRFPEAFNSVDKKTRDWWNTHESKEKEKIKKEALAKLSAREKRALGLK